MKKIFLLFAAVIVMAVTAGAQTTDKSLYTIFDGEGRQVSLDELIGRLSETDVVFLGEYHDDAVGHAFQLEVFKEAYTRFGKERTVALSMEMFERDVQYIVDEYLRDQISEEHFLASSRPWKNYKTDYRPLVEFAKEKRLAVIAANAPRRYVNMVSRSGRNSLDSLSKEARNTLPPLPYGVSSAAYTDKFRSLMSQMPAASGENSNIDKILESQTLWDASMGYSISRFLKKARNPLVVHLNGGFHTESRLGTPEQLKKYRKNTQFLVVTMRYEKDFRKFDPAKHKGIGDFVVLTDASQPRSGK